MCAFESIFSRHEHVTEIKWDFLSRSKNNAQQQQDHFWAAIHVLFPTDSKNVVLLGT